MNQISNEWTEYEVIDTGNKEKLERWNDVILRRPDPVAIWPVKKEDSLWKHPDAFYTRSSSGGGSWTFNKKLKDSWVISYKDLFFKISPTGFKHTGLFPEQAANWDFITRQIQKGIQDGYEDIRILNLFAYTGGATIAAAKAGASEVVHLDASKGIISWAKENAALNHLENKTIRYIMDDALKFIKREQRRGRKYDGIIMDPPSYGRGPNKEVWKLEDNLYELLYEASKLLSNRALFLLVNTYSTGFPMSTLEETLKRTIQDERGGKIEVGETLLPVTRNHSVLPCGLFGRWTR